MRIHRRGTSVMVMGIRIALCAVMRVACHVWWLIERARHPGQGNRAQRDADSALEVLERRHGVRFAVTFDAYVMSL